MSYSSRSTTDLLFTSCRLYAETYERPRHSILGEDPLGRISEMNFLLRLMSRVEEDTTEEDDSIRLYFETIVRESALFVHIERDILYACSPTLSPLFSSCRTAKAPTLLHMPLMTKVNLIIVLVVVATMIMTVAAMARIATTTMMRRMGAVSHRPL